MTKSKAIKDFERRWVKPTIVLLLIIGLPLMYFAIRHGNDSVVAFNDHHASVSEVAKLISSQDKEHYFENTPNRRFDTIIDNKDDIPNRTVMVALYKQHCIFCEVSYPKLKNARKQIREIQPDLEPLVFVDTKSPLGQQLVQDYEITKASTLLLFNKDGELIDRASLGDRDENGKPASNSSAIKRMYQRYLNEIKNEE